MKTLFKNCKVVNVFIDKVVDADVLVEDEKIIGVGAYENKDADCVRDMDEKYICPSFIDGHIHIESSMIEPSEFAKVCLACGTTTLIADPHEIVNVAGKDGLEYMLEATKNVPMNIYFMVPSCVPATKFDEAGASLSADDIVSLLDNPRILGLGEMMNYPGVVFNDGDVLRKIDVTKKSGKIINGHAPMLSGHDLDKYISAGIVDDHECTSLAEAMEKLEKGQKIMIRQGTAARNLKDLLPLFDEPYSRRCMLVTDDKHPADFNEHGHIDGIIRLAAAHGKSVLSGIRMASLQAAEHFGLSDLGAIAPGYKADFLVLNDLETLKICDVYHNGKAVVENKKVKTFPENHIQESVWNAVRNSFNLNPLSAADFLISTQEGNCRVINIVASQIITNEEIKKLDFSNSNGIDISKDILKLAVIERHKNSGHIGLGFISGLGLKEGAIASSVAHDSHNLIVAGTNEEDMAVAANRVREMGGGMVVVKNKEVLAGLELPIAGLMGQKSAEEMTQQDYEIRKAVEQIGHAEGVYPFMNLTFVSLPVIPNIKMTTLGLVDVNKQELVPLFV